ncbi:FtsK/SpoIIIE domain-containing protein [Mycolicibacterium llatzerense]|uniref:FtsK/SpoIIIE domain-containing protein n=1 Tax=Mycolicibacterium llatzerense TaxID=280871 RepID=UPI0021B67AB3|nr:FtsK/SpoIIIE domain-containing protein [Mycolicibacterium llatzerense]MCT7372110.1 hypothetical protein [Mycolicibacterium llatzerense]
MTADDDYFTLLGFDPATADFDTLWANEAPASTVDVPIGVDQNGRKVSIDFGRFAGLDDHHLIVAAPGHGTTGLLKILLLGLMYRRSPRFHNFFVIEGKPAAEYRDFDGVPHLVGRVDQRDDGELTTDRLAQVLAGEIDRRRAGFAAVGVTNLSDYQTRTAGVEEFDGVETPWLPELYIIIDNVSWLLGTDFDAINQVIKTDGHALGIKLIMATPWDTWSRTEASGYFDGLAPRFALGLTAAQVRGVFGSDVPDSLRTPGQAYVQTLDGRTTKCTVARPDAPAPPPSAPPS